LLLLLESLKFFNHISLMKKNIFFGIMMIAAALALLALVFAPHFLKKGSSPPGKIETQKNPGLVEASPDVPGDCNKMGDAAERETCYNRKRLSNVLYVSNNIKDCLQITDVGMEYDCLFRMARRETDVSYCQKILDAKTRESCIQEIAIANNRAEICGLVGEEPFEAQECTDRVKATNIGVIPEAEIPVDYCAGITTLEYGKLCMLNASKYGKTLTGKTDNRAFTDSWNAYLVYRAAKSASDCEKIVFEGGRLACLQKVKYPDYQYFDYDHDGINDDRELWFGTDPSKPDTDGDGLTDLDEMANGADPSNPDTDADGLNDYDEVNVYRSEPGNPDSDADGVADGRAVSQGKDPVANDADKDGLPDALERTIGTDLNNPDTDGDGVNDGAEWNSGYDPLAVGMVPVDTDNDGVTDIEEAFYGTDRFKQDTDGDGSSDREEIELLNNPLGNGFLDFDNDGLSDIKEAEQGTNPAKKDTDGDGVSDDNEVIAGTNPLDNK